VYLLVHSHAQTPYTASSSASGTLSGGANVQNGSDTSGSQYVQFGENTQLDTCSTTASIPTAPVSGYSLGRCDDFNATASSNFTPYTGTNSTVGLGRDPASSSGSLPHPVLILWPNTNNSGDGEIDFVEMNLGADLGAYLHCTTANGGIHANACYTAPYKSFDYSQYHTYSILWTPSGMSEYIDGQLWWTAPAPAASGTTFMPTVGMHLTIQLDNLSGTTPVDPGVMEVDWVHMYATD
jgi:hypothetical protein